MRNFITKLENRFDAWLDRNRRVKTARIARVFKRERGLGSGRLSKTTEICEHPGRCAIGALLAALGVDDHSLMGRAYPTSDEYDMLQDVYGLTYFEVDSVISRNDGAVGSAGCPLPIEQSRICEVNTYVATLA